MVLSMTASLLSNSISVFISSSETGLLRNILESLAGDTTDCSNGVGSTSSCAELSYMGVAVNA